MREPFGRNLERRVSAGLNHFTGAEIGRLMQLLARLALSPTIMWRSIFLSSLLLGIGSVLADDVLVGTGSNFDKIIGKHPFVVAEFYAPWCGHCKHLEPEYAKAAKQLKEEKAGITLVKVDATEENNKALASKYEIQGFPTLKIFRNGNLESPAEYKGPREADGIVSYLKKKALPATVQLTTQAEVTALKAAPVTAVGVFKADSTSEFKAFSSVADVLADELTFGHSFDPDIVEGASKAPSLLLFKGSKTLTYDGKFTPEALQSWISTSSAPTLIDLDDPQHRSAVEKMLQSQDPKFFSFLPKDDSKYDTFIKELTTVAESKTDSTYFVLISSGNQHALDYFGLKAADTPGFVVQDKSSKFIKKGVAPKEAAAFYKDFKAGKLEPFVKSEEPPKDNSGPVKIVTASTFNDIVFGGKNVLIEFYAPWCGHCKKLAPAYEEVGKAFAKDSNIVIAKMDATLNDVTSSKFEVKGFPTINFVSKSGVVSTYSGERSEEDLIKYVKNQSSSGADHTEL